MASSGLVALHSIVRLVHGEPADDPESGWGSLHSMGHDVAERLDPDRGPAVRRAAGRRSASSSGRACSRLFVDPPDRATAIAAF